jgi:PKD repeat protein
MKKFYILFAFFISISSSFGLGLFKDLPPAATISGPNTICQNSTENITFTASGGTAPYTFIYTLNGSAPITISSTGSNSTATVLINSGTLGSFNYNLVSVEDSAAGHTPIMVSGNVNMNVVAAPTVDFTFNDNACSDVSVFFNSSVTGNGPFTYTWNFGDGSAFATQANPSHAFNSLGCGNASFNVTLTVTNGICTISRTKVVTIKQKPDINFEDLNDPFAITPFNNCGNASTNYSINVKNASTSTCISNFSINWGDGNVQSNVTFPITHTYAAIGVYNMVITAIGTNGCSNSKNFTVKNISNPIGGLNSPGSTNNLCAPTQNLQFSITNWGTNSLDTTYTINYGDATGNTIFTQTQLNQSSFYNAVNPSNSLPFPIPHIYNNSSCPSTSFTVNLNITNACGTTPFTLGSISILTKPIANFSSINKSCVNSSVLFTNTTISGYGQNCNQNSIFTWDFGDGSPIITTPLSSPQNINHTFLIAGIYNVTLTATNGCGTTTKTFPICIEPPITPIFTVNTNSGCIPLVVNTTNTTSAINQCSPITYLWSVAYAASFCGTTSAFTYLNGTNASSANPSFNFTQSGSYTITLTTTNSCGTTSTSQIITVKKPPVITAINGILPSYCGSASITPIATFTNCGTNTLSYAWDFPGGMPSTSTSANPGTIAYSTSGSYTVSLVVTNECGASNTFIKNFVIDQAPIINNTVLNQTVCSGSMTSPIVLTSTPNTATYTWTASATTGTTGFTASGTASTIPAQILTNTTNAVGTVTYVITPKIGTCTGTTVNYLVYVNPTPNFTQPTNFTFCNAANTTDINFSSTNSAGTISYSWTNSDPAIGLPLIGTGNIGSFLATNNSNVPISGSISVIPTFTNNGISCNGAAKSFTITINPSGQVNQPQDLVSCVGQTTTVTFTTPTNNPTTTYNWTNDNTAIGLASSGTSNSLNFTAVNSTTNPITSTITVTPTFASGGISCVGTPKTFTITVNPAAQVNTVTPIVVCSGDTIPAILFSTTNTIGTTIYSWTNNNPSIGLTASGNGNIPSFSFTNPTTTVATATIVVSPTLTIGTKSCPGPTKTFTISIQPSVKMTNQGNKTFCNGNSSTVIPFTTSNTVGTTTYSWTNDNTSVGLAASGTGNIGIFNATNTGTSPIVANISVTPTFSNGGVVCVGLSQTFTITINPSGQINSIANVEVCNGNSVPMIQFSTNNTGGTTTYSWTNSNIAIGLAANGISNTIPTFTGNNNGSTSITASITVTPQFTNGTFVCSGTPITFTIKVNPSPTGTIIGNTTVCINATEPQITFTGSSGIAPYTFTYTINNGPNQTINTTSGNSILINVPTNLAGTFVYKLTNVQDSNATSCLNSLNQTVTITVNSTPNFTTQPTPNQMLCVGGTIPIALSATFINGTGIATYQWYSNTINSNSSGTLISGATNATYTPPTFTTVGMYFYYVVITLSGNGCGSISSNAATIEVVADPIITQQPIATQTLCQNETPSNLIVIATGGVGTFAYQWYSNSTNSNTGGILIAGATAANYSPPTNVVGTKYYYCVISQTGLGCSVTSSVSSIIINTSPTITTQPVGNTVCQNGIANTLSFAYANGVGIPTFQWYSNTINSNVGGTIVLFQNSATFTPPTTSIGTFYYYCEITFPDLAGSCSTIKTNAATVIINSGAQIDQQPTPNQILCVGSTIAVPLTATFSNGTGTATYQWYSNTTNSNTNGTIISGATNATYTPPTFTTVGLYFYYVVITLSGNGCGSISSNVATIEVLADPVITQQPIASQTLCQNAIPINLIVAATGGIGTFSYQWFSNTTNSNSGGISITGETNESFTPPTNTVGITYYYCQITQSGLGCNTTSLPSEVRVNVAPTITNHPISNTICLGQSLNPLSIGFINGTGSPIYQWFGNSTNSNSGGTIITNQTTSAFTPSAVTAGTFYYYCVLTFPSLIGGCEVISSDVAIISIEPVPVISNLSITICSGATFNIAPTNSGADIVPLGTTYTWSNPVQNPSGSITGSSAQTTAQNFISQTLNNVTTNPVTATYTITPTSGNCLGQTFELVVTINPATITNAVKTDISCFGSNNGSITTNLTGGIPFTTGNPYNITWTGPNGFSATSSSIFNLEPGIYTITVLDAGGCPVSENFTILEPADIEIVTSTATNVACFGDSTGSISVTVIGGTGNYFYTWTKNGNAFSTNQNISNLTIGNYSLSVTDANNCGPKTANFTITEPPILSVSLANQINIDCFGNSTGSININALGGTPILNAPTGLNYQFIWSGPNGFSSFNQNIANLAAGTYNLLITDGNGCTKNLSVTLTQPQEIFIYAITTPIVCYNDNNASIAITINGGNAPYQIQWSNLASGQYLTNLAPGNYTITVTDANNCINSLTINIPAPPIFDVNPVVTNISCFGANDGSIVLNFVGGIAPINLTWSDGNTSGTTRNNLPPGTYSVVIKDSKPCTITRTFTILEPQPLVLSANLTNALDCNNANSGAINLLVSGGTPPFNFVWNNGTTTEDLNSIPAGNYLVTVIDSRGCMKTAQYSITRPSPMVLNITSNIEANCTNRTIKETFSANISGGLPPYLFNWSSGTVSGSNNQFMTTTQNGLITLTATDAIGCIATVTYDVMLQSLGSSSFDTNSIGISNYSLYSILDPIQFQSTITGNYTSVVWDFGDGTFSNEINPIHTYLIPKNYIVSQTVNYPYGCSYIQKISLDIEKGYIMVLPNAFSPDQLDGYNDTFRPVTKGLTKVRLDIYDTWGSLIYSEVGDNLVGWNGKIKQVSAENGNYYAKISGETFYGTVISENKTFILIK